MQKAETMKPKGGECNLAKSESSVTKLVVRKAVRRPHTHQWGTYGGPLLQYWRMNGPPGRALAVGRTSTSQTRVPGGRLMGHNPGNAN